MKPISFLLSLAILLGLASCLKVLDSSPTPVMTSEKKLELFDHDRHRPAMEEMKLNCLSCHPEREELKDVIPRTYEGPKVTCHDCHRNETMATRTPQKCKLCHEELQSMIPADHQLDWMHRHAIFANVEPAKCSTCHEQSDCINCHLQRNTIQPVVHPRTFRFEHSVQARSEPQKCGSCHQLQYCRDCHRQEGVPF